MITPNDLLTHLRHFHIPTVMGYARTRDNATREDYSMATRQILIDDLTGADDDVQEVSFTISGQTYALDLGVASRARLADVLQPFIDHARTTKRARAAAAHRKTKANNSAPGEVAALRHWARANGYEIGDRGRIPASVREAYTAAAE